MHRVTVPIELTPEEFQALGEIANQKHCTPNEIVEEAVNIFVERQRNRDRRFGSPE